MQLDYDALDLAIFSTLEGVDDVTTLMSTVAAMVYGHDDRYDWVGFYRNVGDNKLEIGPYQGPLGCLFIPFGKGVCGHVAITGEAIIVPDVEEFAGHIACSSSTRSELVLPVHNKNGELLGVFDIDSNQVDAFKQSDLDLILPILKRVFANTHLAQMSSRL